MPRVHLHDFTVNKTVCQSGVFFVVVVVVLGGKKWGEEGVLCLLDKSQFQWIVITLNQDTRELIISATARNT